MRPKPRYFLDTPVRGELFDKQKKRTYPKLIWLYPTALIITALATLASYLWI